MICSKITFFNLVNLKCLLKVYSSIFGKSHDYKSNICLSQPGDNAETEMSSFRILLEQRAFRRGGKIMKKCEEWPGIK